VHEVTTFGRFTLGFAGSPAAWVPSAFSASSWVNTVHASNASCASA
jgi:hypothetical protein